MSLETTPVASVSGASLNRHNTRYNWCGSDGGPQLLHQNSQDQGATLRTAYESMIARYNGVFVTSTYDRPRTPQQAVGDLRQWSYRLARATHGKASRRGEHTRFAAVLEGIRDADMHWHLAFEPPADYAQFEKHVRHEWRKLGQTPNGSDGIKIIQIYDSKGLADYLTKFTRAAGTDRVIFSEQLKDCPVMEPNRFH